MSYYKRYLMVAIPYTLAIWATWNFVPVMVDIPILIALAASIPLIMKRFMMPSLDYEKVKWSCILCGKITNKSPCPRCHSSQFKRA